MRKFKLKQKVAVRPNEALLSCRRYCLLGKVDDRFYDNIFIEDKFYVGRIISFGRSDDVYFLKVEGHPYLVPMSDILMVPYDDAGRLLYD